MGEPERFSGPFSQVRRLYRHQPEIRVIIDSYKERVNRPATLPASFAEKLGLAHNSAVKAIRALADTGELGIFRKGRVRKGGGGKPSRIELFAKVDLREVARVCSEFTSVPTVPEGNGVARRRAGRPSLRDAPSAKVTSTCVPLDVARQIDSLASRERRSRSQMAAILLKEGLTVHSTPGA